MVQARSGLWLLPVLLLQACGNTPLGQQLADSFDSPSESSTVTAPRPASTPAANPQPAQAAKPTPTPAQPAAAEQKTPTPRNDSRVKPLDPQPYRITIRLSAADPSAPAEVVTRSLRDAGIDFEVETIERVQPAATLRVTPEPQGANP